MPFPSTPLDGPLSHSLGPLPLHFPGLSAPSHRTSLAPTSILRRSAPAPASSTPALGSPRHAHLFSPGAGSPRSRHSVNENVDSYFALGTTVGTKTPMNTPSVEGGASGCEGGTTDFVRHLAALCGRPPAAAPLSPRGRTTSSLSKKRGPGLRISDLPPLIFPTTNHTHQNPAFLMAPRDHHMSRGASSLSSGSSSASSCGTNDSEETVTTFSQRLMNAGATPGGETEEKKFFDQVWAEEDQDSESEGEEVELGSFLPHLGGAKMKGAEGQGRAASPFVVHAINWDDEDDE